MSVASRKLVQLCDEEWVSVDAIKRVYVTNTDPQRPGVWYAGVEFEWTNDPNDPDGPCDPFRIYTGEGGQGQDAAMAWMGHFVRRVNGC